MNEQLCIKIQNRDIYQDIFFKKNLQTKRSKTKLLLVSEKSSKQFFN